MARLVWREESQAVRLWWRRSTVAVADDLEAKLDRVLWWLSGPRGRRPDSMDRLMQEVGAKNLLHGTTGRKLRGDYEGHRQSIWMQRGANAIIIGVVAIVICTLLRVPSLLSYIILGVFVAMAAVCFLIGWKHIVRWFGYAYGRTPPTDRKRSASPPNVDEERNHIDQHDEQ